MNLVYFTNYAVIYSKKVFSALGTLSIKPPHASRAIVQVFSVMHIRKLLVNINDDNRIVNFNFRLAHAHFLLHYQKQPNARITG